MKTYSSVIILLLIILVALTQAQQRTVLHAGDRYAFELVAKTSTGDTIKDWNAVGYPVRLFTLPYDANIDTSMRSWSADADAYTWARVYHNSQPIDIWGVTNWTIEPSKFENSVCRLEFACSKALSNLVIHIADTSARVNCIADTLTFLPGPVSQLSLELTSHVPGSNAVYVERPCELILTPMDRYSNETSDSISVQFSAAIPDIFSGQTRYHNFNSGYPVVIDKRTALYTSFLAVHEAASNDTLQKITATGIANPGISATTGDFEILSHPPTAFRLLTPVNHERIRLISYSTPFWFTWEESSDPVRNIAVGRYTGEQCTDAVKYKVVFLDSATLTKTVKLDSDEFGILPRLSLTHGTLNGITEQITGGIALYTNLFWYVLATDGIFPVTNSLDSQYTYRGRYLMVDKAYIPIHPTPPPPKSILLETCYPNPVYGTSAYQFELPEDGNVTIKVYDSHGACVRTLANDYLLKGYYQYELFSRELGAGAYIMVLRLNGNTVQRRFIVAR